jgi:rhodanese-related sulfurtransferase
MELLHFESIQALSQRKFEEVCRINNWDDDNVPSDYAFISIIGTQDCLKHINEEDTTHYFKKQHDNVLNLAFDDVDEDFELEGYKIKAITDEQAKAIVDFVERNKEKKFLVHCRAGQSRSVAIVNFIYTYYRDLHTDVNYKFDTMNHCVNRKLNKAFREKNNNFFENGF